MIAGRVVGERRASSGTHVRFGSKADMCAAKRHVRFTPESGHVQCNYGCPLSPNSGHRAASVTVRMALTSNRANRLRVNFSQASAPKPEPPYTS